MLGTGHPGPNATILQKDARVFAANRGRAEYASGACFMPIGITTDCELAESCLQVVDADRLELATGRLSRRSLRHVVLLPIEDTAVDNNDDTYEYLPPPTLPG